MALIAMDFDHTLVDGETPIAGAKNAINLLRERGHKILIYSANGPEWIEKVLNNADIRFDSIHTGPKPSCDIYVDDRGYHFNGDWPKSVLEILTRLERAS